MFWNVRAMPSARDRVATQSREALARRSVITPPVERVDAGDDVEDRRLAGAVRADEPEDLARVDVERHVVERGDATEAHRDVVELEERLSHRGSLRRRRRRGDVVDELARHQVDVAERLVGELGVGLGDGREHLARPGVGELGGAPAAREDALRSEDHHHDEGDAVPEHPALIEEAESLGEVGHEHGADDHARDVAGPAEHDRGEEQDRELEVEVVGRDRRLVRREERAGETTDARRPSRTPTA